MEKVIYKRGIMVGKLKPLQKIVNVGFGRTRSNSCWWFDEFGILRCDTIRNAWKMGIKNVKEHYDLFCPREIFESYKVVFENQERSGIEYFLRIIKIGDRYDDIQKKLSSGQQVVMKSENTAADMGFITKISRPKFERVPENKNKKTFDFVKVSVFVTKQENTNTLIKQHQSEIYDRIRNVIQNSKTFNKYDVPINFLKCTSAEHFNDGEIEFIFELKMA